MLDVTLPFHLLTTYQLLNATSFTFLIIKTCLQWLKCLLAWIDKALLYITTAANILGKKDLIWKMKLISAPSLSLSIFSTPQQIRNDKIGYRV